MRKLELLPTWDCEAGYVPVYWRPSRNRNGPQLAVLPQLHSILSHVDPHLGVITNLNPTLTLNKDTQQ